MDRGAWWVTVPGVTNSRTQLSDSHMHTFMITKTWKQPKSPSMDKDVEYTYIYIYSLYMSIIYIIYNIYIYISLYVERG